MKVSDLNLSHGQGIKLAILALEDAAAKARGELDEAPRNSPSIRAHWEDRIARTDEALAAVRAILKPLETKGERATDLPEVLG